MEVVFVADVGVRAVNHLADREWKADLTTFVELLLGLVAHGLPYVRVELVDEGAAEQLEMLRVVVEERRFVPWDVFRPRVSMQRASMRSLGACPVVALRERWMAMVAKASSSRHGASGRCRPTMCRSTVP